jgi:hypothetical protein
MDDIVVTLFIPYHSTNTFVDVFNTPNPYSQNPVKSVNPGHTYLLFWATFVNFKTA